MKGSGWTFGAISIVNAIAGGKGVTASVKLGTESTAELENKPGAWKILANGKVVESKLATETVSLALKTAGKNPAEYSGTISTTTVLPMSVGLKTSSSSSSAIALAVFAALGQKAFDPQKIMICSIEASIASGASITGAMDDAAACLLGGINLADNLGRKIERSKLFDKTLKVLIKVPKTQSKRASVDVVQVRKLGKVAEVLYRMSMEGDLWRAMTLNGTLYSTIYGYDGKAALQAVEHGALGASLSGTGPATAAVFEPKMSEEIKRLAEAWALDGSTVIETETNNEHGRIQSLD
ncbi:MAG: shikimate kinase [Thaumarchaeota archaeon]|nr:shikimate kinase [Nitrososphaerota archaeon]